jgi:hypothetical protein
LLTKKGYANEQMKQGENDDSFHKSNFKQYKLNLSNNEQLAWSPFN